MRRKASTCLWALACKWVHPTATWCDEGNYKLYGKPRVGDPLGELVAEALVQSRGPS